MYLCIISVFRVLFWCAQLYIYIYNFIFCMLPILKNSTIHKFHKFLHTSSISCFQFINTPWLQNRVLVVNTLSMCTLGLHDFHGDSSIGIIAKSVPVVLLYDRSVNHFNMHGTLFSTNIASVILKHDLNSEYILIIYFDYLIFCRLRTVWF